ncbi:MAG: glycoside hydrolase family 1 protein, partial [Erysipelotrichaceae bacterium]|nr:glycoside hydrolase family 1 protein [Erysipelotrichaceae bacterium]
MSFRKDFLWGGSISAAQAEGAWNEGGKAPIQVDYGDVGSSSGARHIVYRTKQGNKGHQVQFNRLPEGGEYADFDDVIYSNRTGIDFYHRYKEDIALFGQMGMKVFNTSISWARVFPEGMEGKANEEGVAYYHDLFKECLKHNIQPFVTLSKYDEPLILEKKYGGFENRKMIDEFVHFASFCFEEFREVKLWVTFNEINVLTVARRDKDVYQALHNQMVAASIAVQKGHMIDPENRIGCMVAGQCIYPYTCDPSDVMKAYKQFQDSFAYCADTMVKGKYPSFAQRLWKEKDLVLQISEEDKEDLKKGKADFLAFSYYNSSVATTHEAQDEVLGNLSSGVKNPYLDISDWGWQMDPKGFKYWLHFLNDRYDVPLFDIENGLGAYDEVTDGKVHDQYRIDYLKNHVANMKEAVEEGVDLFGYTVWTPIDVVSFVSGQMDKR